MKIELLRPLWGKESGEIMDVTAGQAEWAVERKAAKYAHEEEKAEKPQKNKAEKAEKNKTEQ